MMTFTLRLEFGTENIGYDAGNKSVLKNVARIWNSRRVQNVSLISSANSMLFFSYISSAFLRLSGDLRFIGHS